MTSDISLEWFNVNYIIQIYVCDVVTFQQTKKDVRIEEMTDRFR